VIKFLTKIVTTFVTQKQASQARAFVSTRQLQRLEALLLNT